MSLFGFSVDLSAPTKKQLTSYVELLAKYQSQLIFISLTGFTHDRQELWEKLKIVTEIAKHNHIFVYAMVDKQFLTDYDLLNKKPKELINFFQKHGLSGIKFDQGVTDLITQAKLTQNNQAFKVIVNGSYNLLNLEKLVLEYHVNSANVISCYNSYHQRYTGTSIDFYLINQYESHLNNIPFAGVVNDGQDQLLGCSIELHRDWSLINQIHHLIALGTDIIVINKRLLSDAELQLIAKIDQTKVTLVVEVVKDATDTERAILFDDQIHFVRPDLAQDLIISPDSKIKDQQLVIKNRKSKQEYFEIGDIVIGNEGMQGAIGQLQIVIKRIKNDGLRNLVAKIKEPYRSHFLSELKATRRFKFIQENN